MRLAPALLVALLIVLIVWSPALSSRQDPASIYAADGLGQWVERGRIDGAPVHILHGPLAGLDPQRSLLVVAPRIGYTDAESAAFASFLVAGGRAVVADDTGAGRQLLRDLSIDIRSGLYSTSFARSPAWPILEGTGMLEQTILYRPHVVTGDGEVLLRAHPLSWQDLDNDLAPDLNEPMGAWAVAMRLQVGAGQLIVVGDAELFFQDVSRPTAQVLMAWLAERPILIDEGHRASADPVQATPLLAGARPGLAIAVVATVWLGALAWNLELRIQRRRPRPRRVASEPAIDELPDGS